MTHIFCNLTYRRHDSLGVGDEPSHGDLVDVYTAGGEYIATGRFVGWLNRERSYDGQIPHFEIAGTCIEANVERDVRLPILDDGPDGLGLYVPGYPRCPDCGGIIAWTERGRALGSRLCVGGAAVSPLRTAESGSISFFATDSPDGCGSSFYDGRDGYLSPVYSVSVEDSWQSERTWWEAERTQRQLAVAPTQESRDIRLRRTFLSWEEEDELRAKWKRDGRCQDCGAKNPLFSDGRCGHCQALTDARSKFAKRVSQCEPVGMDDYFRFRPDDQTEIAKAAGELYYAIEDSLPRVPWLSNVGQQNAFREIFTLVTESAGKLDADDDARKAIVFWTLTILYANKRSFRLATASIKNWGSHGIHSIAQTFVTWVGEDTHPGHVVATCIDTWTEL